MHCWTRELLPPVWALRKRRPTLEEEVHVSNNTCFEILTLMRVHTKSVTCRTVRAILCVLQPDHLSAALLDKGKGEGDAIKRIGL
ncbi:hypothetical protein PoB_007386600 [Plakobranchus ocellatus]|uniref:Uncharacterized protein n=1 Tax=Plakobranchus ocellatus TaxID=259542 RepID=A0AAV4DTG2_9GAST|nr:hypothetical protein PoB_007386600 [Plakobranchus ocellatus]